MKDTVTDSDRSMCYLYIQIIYHESDDMIGNCELVIGLLKDHHHATTVGVMAVGAIEVGAVDVVATGVVDVGAVEATVGLVRVAGIEAAAVAAVVLAGIDVVVGAVGAVAVGSAEAAIPEVGTVTAEGWATAVPTSSIENTSVPAASKKLILFEDNPMLVALCRALT